MKMNINKGLSQICFLQQAPYQGFFMFRQEMDAAARSREFGLGSAGHNVFSETVYFT